MSEKTSGRQTQHNRPDLSVQIGDLVLRNPVMTASGTFGYGREYAGLFDLSLLGAIVVKGTTLLSRDGNAPPRTVETPSGMLNAIGLQNVGVDAFLATELPFLAQFHTPVILNIAGHTIREYGEIASRADGAPGLSALEVNISCPNVEAGGMTFGVSPLVSAQVVGLVKKRTSLPVIAKLSPNVTSVTAIARAVADAGADAVSLINTLVGMVIDIKKKRPVLANITGGLSGPAVRPVALKMVWEAAGAVDIPVIGIGGIATWQDAVEFMLAGATGVQVGSAIFGNPRAPLDVICGLEHYACSEGIASIRDMVGLARKNI